MPVLSLELRTKILSLKIWSWMGLHTSGNDERIGRQGAVQGKVKSGIVLFMIEDKWEQLPHELWVWKPRRTTYRRCGSCNFDRNCKHAGKNDKWEEYDYTMWTPELLCAPGSTASRVSPKSRTVSWLSRSSKRRDIATLGAQLPPELFERIYGSMDDPRQVMACRLVCRYWNRQCQARALADGISLEYSEKRMLDLVRRFKYDPAWQHIPQLVTSLKAIPSYRNKSKAPWLHLLDPRWRQGFLAIVGPFPSHRTIRSIHFTLPRSLPPSMSRKITRLVLKTISFRRFEDTACLVSELPDLEELGFETVVWESLPSVAPRRRPRANRNRLRNVDLIGCKATGSVSPSFAFAAFTLFLNVYEVTSFLSVDILAAVEAILRTVLSTSRICSMNVSRDADGNVDGIELIEGRMNPWRIVSIRTTSHLTGNNNISIFIHPHRTNTKFSIRNSDHWTRLDSTVSLLPQSWCPHFMFGFHSQRHMRQFAVLVVNEQLSSLSRRGTVRYAIARKEKREGDYKERSYWYRASLASDQLRGEGVDDIREVYA